jgi:hypothetical protein
VAVAVAGAVAVTGAVAVAVAGAVAVAVALTGPPPAVPSPAVAAAPHPASNTLAQAAVTSARPREPPGRLRPRVRLQGSVIDPALSIPVLSPAGGRGIYNPDSATG